LSAESAIFPLLTNTNAYRVQMMIMTFDILWWIIPAILLNSASEHFLWTPLETKSGYIIPKILRRFVAFIIYILAFFGIIAFVYNQKITSLLATSGVFAMIIGLAVQMNISNLFSGIAVNLEKPFRIGDWIKIGNYEEGKVIDITWRTTRIQTRFDNILSVPNRIASESVIWNYHYPTDVYRLWFPIQTDPEHQPETVEKILSDTLMAIDGISEYTIRFQGIINKSAEYWVTFSVKDYEKKDVYNNLVWKLVWTRLNEAGIIHRQ
jgi:branched-chain amino acid transport system substrate-binding protein